MSRKVLSNEMADAPNLPVVEIPLSMIRVVDTKNMRRYSPSAKKIEALAQSIREKKLLQPLLVREAPGEDGLSHELVAGYQRLKAVVLNRDQFHGPETVNVSVIRVPEVETVKNEETGEISVKPESERPQLLLNLTENKFRTDLTLIDDAYAIERLMATGMSQREISKEIKKSDSWVSVVSKLTGLRPDIQRRIAEGEIPFAVARVLPGQTEEEQDSTIADYMAAGPGSAQATADKARKKKGKGKRRGSASAQDRTDGRGMSAKGIIRLCEQRTSEIDAQEKKLKVDERKMELYSNLIKLTAGAIGAKAFDNRMTALLD